MEDPSSDQALFEFRCHVCKVSCSSALNLQTHFLGAKHKLVLEALKNKAGDTAVDVKKITKQKKRPHDEVAPSEKTLEGQLNACKSTEPALGLQYIDEYRPKSRSYHNYYCRLCKFPNGRIPMFLHIIGAKHRIAYLSKHHPKLGIRANFKPKNGDRIEKIKDISTNIENKYGRKCINVINRFPRIMLYEGPSVNYNPDSDLQKMDFTTDDFVDIDGKLTPAVPKTFQGDIAVDVKKIAKQKKRPHDEVAPSVETLEGQLNACKSTKPALGLEYIDEYIPENGSHRIYDCRLCNQRHGLADMFMHVVGAKHRIAYLIKHHPELGIRVDFKLKDEDWIKKIKDISTNIENNYGRKCINVIKGSPRIMLTEAPVPSVNYNPDSDLQKMDFSTDDFVDIDGKPLTPAVPKTFRGATSVDLTKIAKQKKCPHDEVAPSEKTLEGQLNACKSTEPALGLEYIDEYISENGCHRFYDCRLCNNRNGLTGMFFHIVGAKHRIAYLSKHHPELGICANFKPRYCDRVKKIKDISTNIENNYGRKCINVIKESPRILTEGPSVNSNPDSDLQKMDFTTNYSFDIDGKPLTPAVPKTF